MYASMFGEIQKILNLEKYLPMGTYDPLKAILRFYVYKTLPD